MVTAIYINLINMVDAFTNLQMDFFFSCKKKEIYEVFCFCRQMENAKLLKGNRLENPMYSFQFTLTFVLINCFNK